MQETLPKMLDIWDQPIPNFRHKQDVNLQRNFSVSDFKVDV